MNVFDQIQQMRESQNHLTGKKSLAKDQSQHSNNQKSSEMEVTEDGTIYGMDPSNKVYSELETNAGFLTKNSNFKDQMYVGRTQIAVSVLREKEIVNKIELTLKNLEGQMNKQNNQEDSKSDINTAPGIVLHNVNGTQLKFILEFLTLQSQGLDTDQIDKAMAFPTDISILVQLMSVADYFLLESF